MLQKEPAGLFHKLYEFPVGIEAIAILDGVFVGLQDLFCSGQCATWLISRVDWEGVEVGQQGFHNLKLVSGIDEQIGFARGGADFATALLGCVFQGAYGGRADCYDSARLRFAPG